MAQPLQISERNITSSSATPPKRYVLSTFVPAGPKAEPDGAAVPTPISRLDLVPAPQSQRASENRVSVVPRLKKYVARHIAPLFLPTGYPHSVAPDYTSYQLYDTAQAFASTVASLLSSRAVLQSIGVGGGGGNDDSASTTTTSASMATYVTLLSVAQNTISNLSTILFAHYVSRRISRDVKYYRFLADIVNDAAFVLDLLSPSLPSRARGLVLCLSSGLRAMCGVAGGSSKAVLSQHFATPRQDFQGLPSGTDSSAAAADVGELNAKDGSQEVLVGLVGMWVGGLVVTRVEGSWAVWSWMLVLLTLHLLFNYLAVCSIRLRTLNAVRMGRVAGALLRLEHVEWVAKKKKRDIQARPPTFEDIGQQEGVFESAYLLRDWFSKSGRCRMGVSLAEFVQAVDGERKRGTGSLVTKSDALVRLLAAFHNERYVLWFDQDTTTAFVLLKDGAQVNDQIKAWAHAAWVADYYKAVPARQPTTDAVELIKVLGIEGQARWEWWLATIVGAGWNLSDSVLEEGQGVRVTVH